jgi:hypothetical protein
MTTQELFLYIHQRRIQLSAFKPQMLHAKHDPARLARIDELDKLELELKRRHHDGNLHHPQL